MKLNGAVLSWLVVTVVGVVVVVLVLALSLFPRLTAAQNLIDAAQPAFSQDRVSGDRAAITMVSNAVDTLDPVVTDQGGAAGEVPSLLAFVSQKTGVPVQDLLTALETNYPHATNLLKALPLSSVTRELTGLVTFLSANLKVSPAQVMAALNSNFPHLAQAINNLPDVTNNWNNVPGTANLTRFDGSPVHTVPQIRDYFSGDVIPVLERQQSHFQSLASDGGVGYLAILLLIVGIVVIAFGVLMMLLARGGLTKTIATSAWSIVILVGLLVVGLVLGVSLFPRLNGGQNLVDDLRPAFTQDRVAGDRAAITMVSKIVAVADPIGTDQGGAAAEVPKLLSFVSQQTGLPVPAVLGALKDHYPDTAALLQALPLSSAANEIPGVVNFVATNLKVSPDQVLAAVRTNFPHLYQAITNLPKITDNWYHVPGTAQLTAFDGSAVHSVPAIQKYFANDVIPLLEQQRDNYTTVDTTPPRLPFFPPLLLIVGIVVVLYGVGNLVLDRRRLD